MVRAWPDSSIRSLREPPSAGANLFGWVESEAARVFEPLESKREARRADLPVCQLGCLMGNQFTRNTRKTLVSYSILALHISLQLKSGPVVGPLGNSLKVFIVY